MNREETEQEVLQLADAWANAELQGDTTFLGNLLTDDFIGIGPLGFLLTKPQWLTRYQSGDLKYTSFSLEETQVRVYNDAAILIGRQVQDGTTRGTRIQAQVRTMLVFVSQDGRWRLASQQMSSIGQPPAFTRG